MADTDKRGTALVTGGAQRIGRVICQTLARAGYGIAIHARRSVDEAQALQAELQSCGARVAIVTGDLGEPATPARIVTEAAAKGPLTVLVNNASIFEPDEIGSLSRAGFDRQLAVNLAAPVFLSEAFAAQAPAGSSIVNVIDQRVLKPTPLFFSYMLSKSALATATVTLAQSLAPKIRVNGVAPGPTLPSSRQDDATFAAQTKALPLQRGPTPEDIAAAVLFLATTASITGTIVPVDGGQHISWRTPDIDGVRE
jgi:NAD(P)-dependent dehydrogenase (short-subunit alcohol dehydrogenase family)